MSAGSSISLKVWSTLPIASPATREKSVSEILPSRSASASCGPALLPNSSMASWYASVSLSPLTSVSDSSFRAWSSGFPSFVALASAFFSPAMTVEESTPALSSSPRNPAAVKMLMPMSSKIVLLSAMPADSSSTLAPVSCDTLASTSRRSPALSLERFHAAMACWVLSIASTTSLSVILENFRYFSASSSASSPEASKRVLTSATAFAESSMATGRVVAIFFALS